MTIINIWSVFDRIQEYLSDNITISALFQWWIYAWKPLDISSWLSLYFSLVNNSPLIETDRNWRKVIKKRALLDFVIITNKKDTPEVVIYEALDSLSNEIVGKEINLNWFIINWIQEWNQSWILVDTNENPLLISQYEIDYETQLIWD